MAMSAHAITLFPFFVDVAGDYEDGMMADLKRSFSNPEATAMYSAKPKFYTSLKEAKAFLQDVLPFSTEKIEVRDIEIDEGAATVVVSPMENGKMSIIYLFEVPEKGFYIAYDETDPPKI